MHTNIVKEWAQINKKNRLNIPSRLHAGIQTHISIDNSDGLERTVSETGTTHYTNGVIIQSNQPQDVPPVPVTQHLNQINL